MPDYPDDAPSALGRHLRVLVGAEAMLSVVTDAPTIRYLLSLTARHAESATVLARRLLLSMERTEEQKPPGEGEAE